MGALLQLIWFKGHNWVITLFMVAVVFVVMGNRVSVEFGLGLVVFAFKSLLHPSQHLLSRSFLWEFLKERMT